MGLLFYRVPPPPLVFEFVETFENPGWLDTYDPNYVPVFSEPAVFVETFETENWPNP